MADLVAAVEVVEAAAVADLEVEWEVAGAAALAAEADLVLVEVWAVGAASAEEVSF